VKGRDQTNSESLHVVDRVIIYEKSVPQDPIVIVEQALRDDLEVTTELLFHHVGGARN